MVFLILVSETDLFAKGQTNLSWCRSQVKGNLNSNSTDWSRKEQFVQETCPSAATQTEVTAEMKIVKRLHRQELETQAWKNIRNIDDLEIADFVTMQWLKKP